MILHIFFKFPKIHTKAIRANKFSKVAGMRLIELNFSCVYTPVVNNPKKEIKKQFHTRKYSGIKLIKEVKDLYTKSHKTVLKKIKENLSNRKDITCS